MELLCIGVSHKTAPVDVRERLAMSAERQAELLQRLGSVGEVMLVSTCNRVEVYVAAAADVAARQKVLDELATLAGNEVHNHLYEHRGQLAAQHLFRVAASLDSMVLGEPQILGQVKDAFELAQKAGTVKGELSRMCHAAFSCAKRVRSETGIGRAAVSMASAAVDLAKKIFGGLDGAAVLLVGAGEMSALAARHLKGAGAKKIVVTNRTLERAQALAEEVGGTARPFEELQQLLIPADVVICSTAAQRPIFTRAVVAPAMKARRHRPLFMVDLAVPRDIAPDVNGIPDVYAYDVDDIEKVVAENAAARAQEAAKAEALIAAELARFVQARVVRAQVPILAQLRSRAQQIAHAETEKTLSRLSGLDEKQRKSIEAMAMAIVNKLLHEPTQRLRTVGTGETNVLADAAAELFGLASAEPDEAPAPASAAIEEGPARSAGGQK